MEYDEKVSALALKIAFPYKPVLVRALISAAGGAAKLFGMDSCERSSLFLSQDLAGVLPASFTDPCKEENLEKASVECEWCEKSGIEVIGYHEPEFPRRLLECADAPVILFKYGNAELNPERSVSIVGTRRATEYGRYSTTGIVSEISEKIPNTLIVSGLAFGTDINAHKCALELGVPTVAILPGALNNIYPSSHRGIASKISKNGALLSDFTRGSESYKINFISRNRIIASMSDVTIIPESGIRGGGLITARLAHSYGREIFAVPGRLTDLLSEGCNSLISENVANVYTGIGDILRVMNWESKSGNGVQLSFYHNIERAEKQKILVSLSSERELSFERLAILTGLKPGELAATLTELELEGYVIGFAGNRYRINVLKNESLR